MKKSIAVLVLLGSTACATQQPVLESEAANDGRFDGTWVGHVSGTEKFQRRGNWVSTCNDVVTTFRFEVRNGLAKGRLEDIAIPPFYIARDGRFLAKKKTEYKAKTTLHSDLGFSSPAITYVLDGNLDQSSRRGRFIIGIEQMGNQGCTTDIRYEREAMQ